MYPPKPTLPIHHIIIAYIQYLDYIFSEVQQQILKSFVAGLIKECISNKLNTICPDDVNIEYTIQKTNKNI